MYIELPIQLVTQDNMKDIGEEESNVEVEQNDHLGIRDKQGSWLIAVRDN